MKCKWGPRKLIQYAEPSDTAFISSPWLNDDNKHSKRISELVNIHISCPGFHVTNRKLRILSLTTSLFVQVSTVHKINFQADRICFQTKTSSNVNHPAINFANEYTPTRQTGRFEPKLLLQHSDVAKTCNLWVRLLLQEMGHCIPCFYNGCHQIPLKLPQEAAF